MKTSCIYGIHAVEKLIQQSPERGIKLWVVEHPNSRLSSIIKQSRRAKISISFASRNTLNQLAHSDKHQGCVLQIQITGTPQKTLEQYIAGLHQHSLFLVLDSIQDPHNLGACLRTADATNVDAVIIPKDHSARLNATVRKVAAGAAESVPLITVTNLVRCLKTLKKAGVWLYGASGQAGASLYAFDYQTPVALVMGSEGEGLRQLTSRQCDHLVKLPMHGIVESLNVSVATGVCLYEILRARQQGSPGRLNRA